MMALVLCILIEKIAIIGCGLNGRDLNSMIIIMYINVVNLVNCLWIIACLDIIKLYVQQVYLSSIDNIIE